MKGRPLHESVLREEGLIVRQESEFTAAKLIVASHGVRPAEQASLHSGTWGEFEEKDERAKNKAQFHAGVTIFGGST